MLRLDHNIATGRRRRLFFLSLLFLAFLPCVISEQADGDQHNNQGSQAQTRDDLRQPPSRPMSSPKPAMPTMSLRRILPKNVNVKVSDVDLVQQIDYGLEAIPSLTAFLAVNYALKFLMRQVMGITKFPHPLVGMFLLFGGLMSMQEQDAAKVVTFFKPGLDLLTNFLPAFFVPGLIVTPLAMKDVSAVDFTKFLSILGLGGAGLYFVIANVVAVLQAKGNRTEQAKSQATKRAGFQSWFSPQLEKIFLTLTAASGILGIFQPDSWSQTFYGISTIFSFVFASRIPRVFNPTFANFWHPLLTTYVTATLWFWGYGALKGKGLLDVLGEYLKTGGVWSSASGNFIMFFLEPAIISFAFGLYHRRVLLIQNAAAIIGGSFTAAFAGIVLMAALARAFNPSRTVKLALLPRATAALAIVQAGMIGASTALTTVNCCLTGIAGANFGPKLLDLFGQRDPIARGVATGGAGLALASAALALNDPLSFPFGALAMAITSTFATLLFSIPQFSNFVLSIAGA